MLGFDLEACTACGLCQPACPQGAVTATGQLPANARSVLARCQQCSAGDEATIGCIHAIDLAMLAELHARGIRTIVTETGKCDDCTYGRPPHIAGRLDDFNAILSSRQLETMALASGAAGVRTVFDYSSGERDEADPGRRRLLLALTGRMPEGTDAPPARTAALVALLARGTGKNDSGALCQWVPSIDARACRACGLCVKACPSGALDRCQTENATLAYRILPGSCTGCGLCVDLCDTDAIALSSMSPGKVTELPLASATCRACGVAFDIVGREPEPEALCQICARTRHRSKLFQVLK